MNLASSRPVRVRSVGITPLSRSFLNRVTFSGPQPRLAWTDHKGQASRDASFYDDASDSLGHGALGRLPWRIEAAEREHVDGPSRLTGRYEIRHDLTNNAAKLVAVSREA